MAKHLIINNPLRSYLHDTEKLLWEGQPQVRTFALRGSWVGVIIGLAFIGITILVTREMVRTNAPPWVYLFSTFFVLIGLYCIFGRLIVASLDAKRTFYVVTNQRILIFSSHFLQERLADIALTEISEPSITTIIYNVGTIYFNPPPTYGPFGKMEVAGFPTADNNWTYVPLAFQCIEKYAEVLNIIKPAKEVL